MTSSDCSLSIELLPEFGWSIKGEHVYGPGSVFQGSVKVNLHTPLPVERVRLAFYATESVPYFDYSLSIPRQAKKTLFSIQNTLWESPGHLYPKVDYSFPFTIQMPMIQFPPSTDHSKYQCLFQLIAIVDTGDNTVIKSVVPVKCMPFVETSLLKSPMVKHARKGDLSARVRMVAQEFVAGDSIPISLHVGKHSKKPAGSLDYVTVQLELVQTLSFLHTNEIPDQTKIVAASTSKLLLINSACEADFELKVPVDASPSCDYSKLVKISYTLKVSADQKGPLGGIWRYSVGVEDTLITIGTLGYGIRTSNELKLYSDMVENVSSPKFMKSIEYEDALPLYDACKLPTYEQTITLF